MLFFFFFFNLSSRISTSILKINTLVIVNQSTHSFFSENEKAYFKIL